MAEGRWVVVEFPGPGPFQTWAVAKVDGNDVVEHTHPIYFPYEREAERAAARLNVRDSGITGEPVPVPSEADARAVRQSRLAELRAKRDARNAP